VKNLRKRFDAALGLERSRKIDINSIDGFQGREKDVCIFSVVRAPAHGRGLGFVADARRINVGLTRARQGITLVHFSAQLEPFLTQNTPQTPPNEP
jgi:senataxin